MDAPAHLPEPVQRAWLEITEGMTQAGVEGAEAPALEAYATAVARMRDAQERVAREGLLIADAKGNPMPHPALAIEKSAAAEVRAWVSRYRRSVRR